MVTVSYFTTQGVQQRLLRPLWPCLVLLAFSLLFVCMSFAEGQKSQNVIEELKEVEYSKWEEKEEVLKEIQQRKLKLSDAEKAMLIAMFEKESMFQEEYVTKLKKEGFTLNEALTKFHEEYDRKGYDRYFMNFASLASSFKDVRTIPALLRGPYTIPLKVIAMGEKAVEPLIEITKSKDGNLKSSALSVLASWVNAPIATEDYSIAEEMAIKDTKLLDRIKAFFLKALHDKDVRVRSSAVYGLGAFPDISVMRELEEIAKSDTYSFYNKFSNKTQYPIREDAKRSLEKLKAKMKGGDAQK